MVSETSWKKCKKGKSLTLIKLFIHYILLCYVLLLKRTLFTFILL